MFRIRQDEMIVVAAADRASVTVEQCRQTLDWRRVVVTDDNDFKHRTISFRTSDNVTSGLGKLLASRCNALRDVSGKARYAPGCSL